MSSATKFANTAVYVRVRPDASKACVHRKTATAIEVQSAPKTKTYTFDHVSKDETQESLFERVGAPLTMSCLDGINGTIFAYGQTASGKTYTMSGPEGCKAGDEQRGVMPRVFELLFAEIAKREAADGRLKYTVAVSFCEIYGDAIYDLMKANAHDGKALALREEGGKSGNMFVDNLTSHDVTRGVAGALKVMQTGLHNRSVAETQLNSRSSRSHSIFDITITSTVTSTRATPTPAPTTTTRARRGSKLAEEKLNSVAVVKTAQLRLVDLAGSERQVGHARTHVTLQYYLFALVSL
jgi:hypothetical protein